MRETEFLTGLYKCFGMDVLVWVMGNGYETYKQKLLDGKAVEILRDYLINAKMEDKFEESIQKFYNLGLEPDAINECKTWLSKKQISKSTSLKMKKYRSSKRNHISKN